MDLKNVFVCKTVQAFTPSVCKCLELEMSSSSAVFHPLADSCSLTKDYGDYSLLFLSNHFFLPGAAAAMACKLVSFSTVSAQSLVSSWPAFMEPG